ncbi:MAG: hypothetical protein HN352_13545 [Bacteroidetes bacterium]|jgi:signal transduction histidine kinase|nr:hypothetical protein [Bacteroidota bacterium]MBT3749571.1 hypothetical protein [Bacteroidota bacterium]MBT4399112.1 hypothetical protein [Bacteroidota bacterium]MBT4408925.1 hypothetical protein [Bacteroidota bacterium]MBT7095473.1 hypothetical protein [Bacteroidota bacterium]
MLTTILASLLIVSLFICVWLYRHYRKQLSVDHSPSANESLWQNLTNNIPDIVIQLSCDLHIDFINSASSEHLIQTPDTYHNKAINDLISGEKLTGLTREFIENICQSGEPDYCDVSREISEARKEYFEFRFIPVVEENANIKCLLIIGQDISLRKSAEKNLHSAIIQAENSDKLKSAFLANMSHEIRTPLNAIVGFSNLILEDDVSNEEKAKYYQHIHQNSNQLISLINDIIDISKIESSQLTISESEFNLNEHLRELEEIAINEKMNRDKSHLLVFLETDMSDNQSLIYNDAYRLRQILINLLINAIKFTPKGFIQFGYRLLEEKKLLFYVRDSGIGIATEEQNAVFQHFRQLESTMSRRFGGTGLGLSICRNLVTLMGGRIWLQSEPGKGTTFYFTLPYKNQSESS